MNKYDIFIAYSHYDVGKEYAQKLYNLLTEETLLRVFIDSKSNLSTNDTTLALKQSSVVVLLLTSKTLETIKREMSKRKDERSMLIRELNELAKFDESRIIPLNIVEGKDIDSNEIRFVRKRLDNKEYSEIKKEYQFLSSINYIKTNYNEPLSKQTIIDIIERLSRYEKATQKHRRTKHIIALTVIILFALFTAVFYYLRAENLKEQLNDKKIVLIGGGTAKQYFLCHGINPDTMPNTVMMHAPSQLVWPLLAETYKDTSDNENYTTIVLSSQTIKSVDQLFSQWDSIQLTNSHRLIDLLLDSIPLQVGIYPKNAYKQFKDSITVSQLKELIGNLKENNLFLVTTSKHSGTLNTFQELLYKDKLNKDKLNKDKLIGAPIRPSRPDLLQGYYLDEKGNKRYSAIIVLQNELYNIKNNETDNIKILKVYDDSIHKQSKLPLHLYMMIKKIHGNNEIELDIDTNSRLFYILSQLGWDGDKTFDDTGDMIIHLNKKNQ